MMCPDDMQMTCACRRCADDVHIMPGVVLHEIWQLRQKDAILQLCIKPNMASLLYHSKIEKLVFTIISVEC